MKIFQIIFSLSSGGAERLVVNLSNELAKGHAVSIISVQKLDDANSFYKNLISSGVSVIDLSNTRGITLKAVYQVFHLIRKNKPDIVHAHLNTIFFCFLPALFLSKNVNFFHTLHSLADKTVGFKFQKSINKYFYKKKITPIGISNLCGESFKKFYDLPNISIIENGVPEPKKSPLFPNVRLEFEEYRNTKSTKIFVNVTRLSKEKNHELLISSFNELIKEGHDISLIIIGRSENRAYYDNLRSISINGIYFLGEKSNPIDYLLNSNCFVLSSLWEGLPMTILEAMSCGLPTVSSPVGGIPDILREQYLGVLSKDLEIKNFKKSIIDFLNKGSDTYDKIKIYKYFSANYSIKLCSEKHLNLYNNQNKF